MKNKIAILAACATALSPIMATPAFAAADPNATVENTMQTTCNSYVTGNYGPTTESESSTYYSFEVAYTATDGDPVVVDGSRINDDSTWTPDTTSTRTLKGADASQSTALVRNGKSPNIFATDVKASSETWSNNSVDYTVETTVTTTFAYKCDVTKHQWTPPVGPTPPSGAIYDYQHKTNPGSNDCDKYDGPVYWGQTHGNCVLVDTEYTIPGTDGTPGFFTDVGIGPVGDFSTSQTSDPERGDPITDPNAGPHTYYDTGATGSAVVCISPGSKGGVWRTQNYYTGLTPQKPCSNDTFYGISTQTIPSNSLPVG